MKRILPVAALAAAAILAAACEKPQADTAYLNSGASATPAMPPASWPTKPATEYSPRDTLGQPLESPVAQGPSAEARESTTSAAVSDTASPSTAARSGG